MMKTNGTYIFQSANFVKKNHYTENNNNETAQDLYKLFVFELKEMYWSELMMAKTVMKMIRNTNDLYLIHLLKSNVEVTNFQIIRIEDLFLALDEKIATKKCEAINEIIIEANDYIKHYEKGKFKDEIMIHNLHKIAQYKLDSYESFLEYANSIKESEAAGYILELLNEEIELESKLAEVLDSNTNSSIPAYL